MEVLKWTQLNVFMFSILLVRMAKPDSVFYLTSYKRSSGVTIIDDGHFRSEGKAVSSLDCISRCTDCSAVKYDVTTKQCYSYPGMNHTVAPSTGSGVWFSVGQNEVPVFIAQRADASMMSHAEASVLCQQVQGELASTMDLHIAWSNGYHMCRCGWLGDTTVRFTTTFDDSSCDLSWTSANSMVTCKDENGQYPDYVQSAYCTRN